MLDKIVNLYSDFCIIIENIKNTELRGPMTQTSQPICSDDVFDYGTFYPVVHFEFFIYACFDVYMAKKYWMKQQFRTHHHVIKCLFIETLVLYTVLHQHPIL